MTRPITKAVCLFITLLMSLASIAKTKEVDNATFFKGRSTAILDRLLARGIDRIGQVDLRQIRTAAPEISWRNIRPGEIKPAFTGQRSSAFFMRELNEITVISEPKHFSDDVIDILSLHETAQILGIEDTNYENSLRMNILSKTDDSQVAIALTTSLKNLRVAEHGGTSVGGGGDLTAIAAKMMVLERILKRTPGTNPEFLEYFSTLAFEPNYDPSITFAKLKIKFTSTPGSNTAEGMQTTFIQIPAHYWVEADALEQSRISSNIYHLLIDLKLAPSSAAAKL